MTKIICWVSILRVVCKKFKMELFLGKRESNRLCEQWVCCILWLCANIYFYENSFLRGAVQSWFVNRINQQIAILSYELGTFGFEYTYFEITSQILTRLFFSHFEINRKVNRQVNRRFIHYIHSSIELLWKCWILGLRVSRVRQKSSEYVDLIEKSR